MMNNLDISNTGRLYATIRDILLSARQKAYSAVNASMVQSYWQTGKLITEEEPKRDTLCPELTWSHSDFSNSHIYAYQL